MNRNKLFDELVKLCKTKLTINDRGIKHNQNVSYFVPSNIGNLMLNENTKVEFINHNDLTNDVTIEVYTIDKNGDYIVGTSKKLYKDKTSLRPITSNELVDLITNINNLYFKK